MTFDDFTPRERTISGALALAMHLLFFVLLVVGVSWQPKRTAAPVMVELWGELPPVPKRKPAPPEPEPVKQAPRPPPRTEPKPELKPLPKPDIALKEQLIKKKREERERELAEKAERERKARELEEKLAKEKAERERKLKAEQEAKRKKERELAEQKKREEDKQKRLAEEKRRKEEQARIAKEKEEQLRNLLARQEAEAAALSRLDAYSRLVGDKIKRYIVLPPNIQGNPEAQFEVVQIPGGEILTVKLKRSSGNPAYDAAVERAIRKAQPLPPPPDPARFGEVRELELKFRPKE